MTSAPIAPIPCDEARLHLLERRRGRLSADLTAPVDAHLDGCAACRAEDEADGRLEQRLRELPALDAPAAFRQRMAALADQPVGPATPPAPRPSSRRRLLTALLPSLAVAAALLIAIPAWYELAVVPARLARAERGRLRGEAVNDHLRVLAGEQPLAIVSSGIHEVKPWFAGKLDFAPVVTFAGDADFPLQGGRVAGFLDRKAAVLVYRRRLHTITLFVVRAEGLPWPAPPVGPQRERGFHVLLWRSDELGYALVSDLDPGELAVLAGKLGAPLR